MNTRLIIVMLYQKAITREFTLAVAEIFYKMVEKKKLADLNTILENCNYSRVQNDIIYLVLKTVSPIRNSLNWSRIKKKIEYKKDLSDSVKDLLNETS